MRRIPHPMSKKNNDQNQVPEETKEETRRK